MNNLLPLYIDPGTGSAIFSIVIGLTAAVFFLFQALYIRAKVFFSGGRIKNETKNKFVIYAEDKRYWNNFKPVIEEFEKRAIDLLYLTSSKDDPVFASEFNHIKAECLGEGNKAFARLNLLSADFVLSTTPGLDVYQWKRSKRVKHYSHIRHSADEPVKYELFGMDYFDSILLSGSGFQENDIRKLEAVRNLPKKQIITVGCPYLDEFAEEMSRLPDEESKIFTVLVSPSWGKSALLSVFGEKLLDPLVKTSWRIIVRPHPQSLIVEKEMIDKLILNYKQNTNLEWDFERNNTASLKKADAMISDFSGIILDYMFLRNKPVFYVPKKLDWRTRDAYEIYKDQDEMWTFRNLKRTGIEINLDLLSELPEQIIKASKSSAMETAMAEIKSEAWHYQGEAGKRIADFMINTVESLYQ